VGGGIYCANASPQFKNLIIDSNTVVDWGGGIFIMNSSSTFQDIQIINNTAGHSGGLMNWVGANTIFNNLDVRQNHAGHGGGMQIIESDPVLENANISYNTSNVGAGLYIGDANPLIINSFVQNNTSQSIAGGILFWNFGGEDNCPTLKNVLVTDNNSESGAGIYYEGIVNTKLINVTIANNTASGSGGGIYCYSTYLLNSIIWGNTPDQIDYFGPQDSVIIMYSDVSGGWNGLGNINADPLFKSVNDYHLSQGSPCINTGIPDTSGLSLPLYDIEGNERILYGRIDMGCYEYLNPLVIAENTNSVLHIFPNPVSDFININYLQPNSTVSIYDMMGKLVYYNHITTNQINVSEFTNGVYLLKIETVKEIVTNKFLKQ
jgi:predicted outer membrane repeat protein